MLKLFILVEGPQDEQFFKQLLEKKGCFIEKWGNKVKCIQYANKLATIRNHLNSFLGLDNTTTFLTIDADFYNIDHEKFISYDRTCHGIIEYATNCFNFEDKEKIVVVVEEIESWYLAGFPKDFCERNKITFLPNTENLTKEKFKSLCKNKSVTELRNFLCQKHNDFSIEEAKNRNKSFAKFIDRL